ncbi:hypothetical protein DAPPUDRAFT_303010 [Daphnia pulex]|uniref:UPAR/Ly6 domain-containing protein n=1 Tax=Daphnia pulex TaxID=6669 RepID=E9FSZ3_DAPPU|nr:hypothetical protein DAPPUDRAFT_303010 [Daphnia pulex]|eukprot:EFX89277.1 hypothetical protein DAPPUDRAFT_303010 [Daphnia pulex]
MMKVCFVCFALVLLSWTSRAQGIKCYECASNSLAKDENCETGVSRSAPKSCPATAKFCDYVKLKVETGLVTLSLVYRGCASEDSAWMPKNVGFEDKKMGIATISYRSCNKDLCNGDSWNNSMYNSSPGSRSFLYGHLFVLTILISLFSYSCL